MNKYLKKIVQRDASRAAARDATPQSAPLSGTNQIRNSAGGYVWQADRWEYLKRFLILGSQGGSYYASEQTLTVKNANHVIDCIKTDGLRTVKEIVAISEDGRAPKNDPAIFALALASALGDDATRKAALDALPKVARTGTHLFTYAEMVKGVRGWGRGLRRALGNWYLSRDARSVAYQMVKYRQRGGWTHSDVLRVAHPNTEDATLNTLFKWVTKRGAEKRGAEKRDTDESPDTLAWATSLAPPEDDALRFVWAFERAQRTHHVGELVKLIEAYDLPREALPTWALREREIWEAMLPKMPYTAMLRNIANMTRAGVLRTHAEATRTVIERLTDMDHIQRARVHPIAVLSALKVYNMGYSPHGQRPGRHLYWSYGGEPTQEREWEPVAMISDALETAFELSFKTIEPSNKRMMLALDVSGSMAMGMIAGVAGLTPRDASAAMAMVTARTEPNYEVVSFQHRIVPLSMTRKMSLTDTIDAVSNLPFGRTDCAQPMLYALKHQIPVDTFVIYTDNETWFGSVHPAVALRDYREQMGIDARLVVVGMLANKFTIADPDDKGMLDVVGFDTSAPAIISDFARGTL